MFGLSILATVDIPILKEDTTVWTSVGGDKLSRHHQFLFLDGSYPFDNAMHPSLDWQAI